MADASRLDTTARPVRAVQVAPDHYNFERYDDRERWMSYWHQIRAVLAIRPKTVLEIGPGSGVFRCYLEHAGIAVKTLDIDSRRRADYIGDVAHLDSVLPAGVSFDAVCAFQVLEHLPFDEFETCLARIAQRASRHAFISLPYRGLRVRCAVWIDDYVMSAGHKIMLPWRYTPIPEHCWEMGYPHTARRITKVIAKYFDVASRGFIPENPYHYMWQLRRRETRSSAV